MSIPSSPASCSDGSVSSQPAADEVVAPAESAPAGASAPVAADPSAPADPSVPEPQPASEPTTGSAVASAPVAPPTAVDIFGDRLPLAMQYAESLATDGIIRGLIGPRETPRLWDRHILNCAVIGEAIPEAATVVDIGSGGGLPGIPLAIARPDLQITLVEPMLRRTTYLEEIIEKLGLTNVRVLRGKAQNPDIVREAAGAQVVTSRAVASLGALAEMSMPLLAMGGHMMAMKGDIVQEEIDRDAQTIADCGGSPATARVVGGDLLEHPTYLAITQRVGTARRPSKKTTKKSRKPAGAAGTQRKQSGERRHSAPDGSRATTYRASRDSDRWDGRQYRGPRDGDRRDSGQYRGPRDGDRRDGGQYRGESGRYYSGGRSRRGDGGQDHYGHRGTGRRANPFRRDGGTERNGR